MQEQEQKLRGEYLGLGGSANSSIPNYFLYIIIGISFLAVCIFVCMLSILHSWPFRCTVVTCHSLVHRSSAGCRALCKASNRGERHRPALVLVLGPEPA